MAASLISGGKITVPAAGTPVNVPVPPSVAGPGSPGLTTVHAFVVQALAANTGKVYIGIAGLNKSTLANVLIVLPVPTANLLPAFSVSITAAANALSLSDLWIDVDNNGDGVLLSGIVA